MLNCRKGDLAIIVRSINPTSPNIGKIVRCLEFIPERGHRWTSLSSDKVQTNAYPSWFIDIEIDRYDTETGMLLSKAPIVSDKNLCPIRDIDGLDETLELVGNPKYETESNIA